MLKKITEGGQIWAHRISMTKQVLKIAIFSSLVISSGFFITKTMSIPRIYYQALYYNIIASISEPIDGSVSVNTQFWKKVSSQDSSKEEVEIKASKVKSQSQKYVKYLKVLTVTNLDKALKVGIFSFFGFLTLFLFKGILSRRKTHVSGKKICSPSALKLRLRLTFQASKIKLASLPLVKNTENQHLLVTGATGSGKTNTFHHLLPQIRNQKQRAIIVDTSGEYVAKYYREGKDILMNPFDKRSVDWHPWCEGTSISDLKTMSHILVPPSNKEDETFWRKGSQGVVFEALQKTIDHKTSSLVNLLLYENLPTLSEAMRGTAATAFADMSSDKTAGSIRAMLASFVESLELLKDTQTPFSIKNWVQNNSEDSWLFLHCTVQQRASVIPLLSTWVSIAISGLMEIKEPDQNRKLWFVMDELARLNQLKDLEKLVTECRKYGGCAALAIQSPAQLEENYGRERTRTILGNCSTRIAFVENDPETANSISKIFGETEQIETQEGISYGSNSIRDGVNLSFQQKAKPVVSSSSLQALKKHQAFIKLPGNLPITKIKLKYQNLPKISPYFVEKGK
ncbi:MAG: type IV secretion system DNA-binding domain-containing protein [Chlamydiae bacterium]|nr:type IV secretion system DNA-binding domain-containing protein [Chlamydiota bacterium]